MKNELKLLNKEDRLTSTELGDIVGGKKKIVVKCNIEIIICYVEKTDSTSTPKH